MRVISLLIFLCLFVAPVIAQDDDPLPDDLVIAWAAGGDLTVLTGDESRIVATGGVGRAFLSPDAAQIAFTRADDTELWLIDLRTDESRQIDVPAVIGQVAWRDADTLLVNTLAIDDLGLRPREDLFWIDVESDTVTGMPVGGGISVSPDGSAVVITQAGTFGHADAVGAIYWQDATLEAVPVQLMTFDPVASGSHFPYYPSIVWTDDGSARSAIPEAEALYAEFAADATSTALWALSADGAEQVGSLERASFFGPVAWSPDGSWIVYGSRDGDNLENLNLLTRQVNDDDPTVAVDLPEPLLTLPEIVWLGTGEALVGVENRFLAIDPLGQRRVWFELPTGDLLQYEQVGTYLVAISRDNVGFHVLLARLDDSPMTWWQVAQLQTLPDVSLATR